MNMYKTLDLTDSSEEFRARFWSKVDVRGEDECWEWTAYRTRHGYGQFTVSNGVFNTASRVSMALIEPVPAGTHVCHACDNPPCVNPRHLFIGTPAENSLDSVSKGRAKRSRGSDHRDARLNEEIVREIRATSISHGVKSELAKKYGVSLSSIRKVLERRSWTHV